MNEPAIRYGTDEKAFYIFSLEEPTLERVRRLVDRWCDHWFFVESRGALHAIFPLGPDEKSRLKAVMGITRLERGIRRLGIMPAYNTDVGIPPADFRIMYEMRTKDARKAARFAIADMKEGDVDAVSLGHDGTSLSRLTTFMERLG